MSGGLRNFTSNPHYPVNRWVMTGQVLTGLPDTLTIPSLMGQVDWAPEAFTLLSHWTGQVGLDLPHYRCTTTHFPRTTEETDHNPHSRNRATGTEVTLTDQ